jgi:dihydrofolate reductase
MRKLILDQWVSLDGYVADKNGQIDFFTGLVSSKEENIYSDLDQLAFLETIDTILLGRKTYEMFVDYWPNRTIREEIIADKLNEIPKIVFSNTLKKATWPKWPDATVISGNVANKIRELKTREGKNIVVWGSILLSHLLIAENLFDEYRIRICPVVLGNGRPLFLDQMNYMKLKLQEVKKYDTGVVFLSYTVS